MASLAALQSSLRSLWETRDYHDVIVKCGRRTWKVHRASLAPRAAFFEKALSSGKKGPAFKEGQTGTIFLKGGRSRDGRPHVQFLYLLEYSAPKGYDDDITYELTTEATTDSALFSALKIHAAMFALAEKYQCDSLKVYARDSFQMNYACRCLAADAFIIIVELVYTSTMESVKELKNVLVDGQSAMAIERKLRDYRAHVTDWEAFSSFVCDVLSKAKQEKEEMQEDIKQNFTKVKPPCNNCREPVRAMIYSDGL